MTRARGASRPRFRLLPTVLLTLAILLLPTAVYAWGRNSSSFSIETITVGGTHLVRDKQALKLLRRDYAGRNLFTVTADDVRETLAPLCFVSGAAIDRDFPHTLAVHLTEYEPAAYGLAGDRWYVLDREGRVVCKAAVAAEQLGGKAAGTPGGDPSPEAIAAGESTSGATAPAAGGKEDVTGRLVAGPERAALTLPRIALSGRVREGAVVADREARAMLRVIAALPRSLQRGLAALESDGGLLTLRFDGGPVVVWGDDQRTLAKTVALRTVLREYEKAGKTCTRMDVSIPDRTLAKPVLR